MVDGYTLFMRISIHDSSCNCYQPLNPQEARIAAHSHSPTRYPSGSQLITARAISIKSSNSHPNGNIELEAPWIDVHTLVVDRITHSL